MSPAADADGRELHIERLALQRNRPGRGGGGHARPARRGGARRPACPAAAGGDLGRVRIQLTADAAEQGRPDLLARRIAGELGRIFARGQGPGAPGEEAAR